MVTTILFVQLSIENFSMNTATNNDLKELKDLITQLNDRMETRFNEVDRKIEKLSEDVYETKIDIATIKSNVH